MPAPHLRAALGPCLLASALGLLGNALAQPAPPPAAQPAEPEATKSAKPAPAETTTLKRVEINASRATEVDERRQSTASKIIIGRDEIEKFGDSTVGEILKRLPGVTVQGAPGRGGNVRMRGLGSGYTQLLIDGERVPPGFSFDSLLPEQIERIEALRAPTAETGARAIAGTINVITRGGYRKRINDLRLGTGIERGHAEPGLSWTRNDSLGELVYNVSLSANHSERETDTVTTTEGVDIASGLRTLSQREASHSFEKRNNLHATGRLQGRGGEGQTWVLMPLLIASNGHTRRSGEFTQFFGPPPAPNAPALYATSGTVGEGSFSLARMSGQFTQRFSAESSLELRGGVGQGRFKGNSLRTDLINAATAARTLDDRSDTRDTSANANLKFNRSVGEDGAHKLVAGAEIEANRRNEQRITLQNGAPLLADFGDNIAASSTRSALYAQDDWNLTPQWAANAGLRWEGIATKGSGNTAADASNRSSVWTPLLHAVFKPDPKGRDQIRASLTRSYRAPTLQNLIARPSINSLYPLPGGNDAVHPDRAGNPNLKPELATGLDVAFERYLPGNGLLSANVFQRRISNYLRSVTAVEAVGYASVPRYVLRVQNVGDAVTQGIELEAKFRLSELWPELPRIDLRANASAFRSRVQTVPGPDNRLDGQPGGTANLGGDYRFTGLPLTVGGNLNWTPAYSTRLSDVQTAYQGRKLVADAYALWVLGPALQLRVSASNLNPRDYQTGSAQDADGVRETALNTSPSYVNWQLRLELKL